MSCKRNIVIAGLLFVILCCTACADKQKENPYGDTVAALGDEDAYAFLEMDYEQYVMVTSDGIYDEGTESQASTYCTVYYYGDGAVKNLGMIMSAGTAYPISFSKDGIFVESGHSVEKYAISEKDNTLYLEKGVYEIYDASGNSTYTCATDENETESTEEEYQALLEECGESQIIHFSYGSDGCLNEIRE